MLTDETPYYAEISILVDGWPWNLSDFDFRRWFAPGAMPSLLETAERMGETRAVEHAPPVSENRRVAQPTYAGRRRKRKHSNEQPKSAKRAAEQAKYGRKVA
jgi:hypothetical protein